jgi:hypothetical protein
MFGKNAPLPPGFIPPQNVILQGSTISATGEPVLISPEGTTFMKPKQTTIDSTKNTLIENIKEKGSELIGNIQDTANTQVTRSVVGYLVLKVVGGIVLLVLIYKFIYKPLKKLKK